MELWFSLWFMIVCSFIIQYLAMSIIMTNSLNNITFSLGKFYISVIMSLFMGLTEVVMFDIHMQTVSFVYYLSLGIFLFLFIYLYRNQIYVDDKEYLAEMIEHHSMAILTSDGILQKHPTLQIKNLAENIISIQEKEINYMKQLIIH